MRTYRDNAYWIQNSLQVNALKIGTTFIIQ